MYNAMVQSFEFLTARFNDLLLLTVMSNSKSIFGFLFIFHLVDVTLQLLIIYLKNELNARYIKVNP